jgi:vacuolar-type H+-ATPase subunit H
MGEKTPGECAHTPRREINVEQAVRLLTEGLSREIREASEASAKEIHEFREETRQAREEARQARETAALEARRTREALVEDARQTRKEIRQTWQASAQDAREIGRSTIRWTLGGIAIVFGIAIAVILLFEQRNWEKAMRAYDRGTAAIERGNPETIRQGATKLAEQWLRENGYVPRRVKQRGNNAGERPHSMAE